MVLALEITGAAWYLFFGGKNREKVNGMDPSIRRFARGWLGLKIMVSSNSGISTFEALLLGRSPGVSPLQGR